VPDARNREEYLDVRGEESDVRDARDRGPNYYLLFRELEAAGPHLPLQSKGARLSEQEHWFQLFNFECLRLVFQTPQTSSRGSIRVSI